MNIGDRKNKGVHALAIVVLAVCGLGTASEASIIAQWTFETTQPATAGDHIADFGAKKDASVVRRIHSNPSATFSSPAGNNSATAFASTHWSAFDYLEFEVSTLGFESISFQWDQMRTADGPGAFRLFWSTDGVNFTMETIFAVTTSWQTYSAMSMPSNLDDQGTVYFRLMTSNTAVGTVAIDNVIVTGLAIPTPGALSLLGIAGLLGLRRRRRSA